MRCSNLILRDLTSPAFHVGTGGGGIKVGLVAETAGLLALDLIPFVVAKSLTGRGRRVLRVQLAPIRAKA